MCIITGTSSSFQSHFAIRPMKRYLLRLLNTIDNSQRPPRSQDNAKETRLLSIQEPLGRPTASTRPRPRVLADLALRVPSGLRRSAATTAAAAVTDPAEALVGVVVRGRAVAVAGAAGRGHEGGGRGARVAVRDGEVALVGADLAAVEVGAVAEVQGEGAEDAGDDARGDEARVGVAVAAAVGAGCAGRGGGRAGLRHREDRGLAREEGTARRRPDGGLRDRRRAFLVTSDDLLHRIRDRVPIRSGEDKVVGVGIGIVVSGAEVVLPLQLGGVKDVEARVAGNVLADVTTHDDNLAVVHGTGVTGAGGRGLVGFGDLEPCEGGDGEDVHVVVLLLVALNISISILDLGEGILELEGTYVWL